MTILSNIIKNSNLVSYHDWSNYIDSLRVQVTINNEKDAIAKLKDKLIDAVKHRIPNKRFGILFSGGIDSSLIAFLCKKFTDNFVCYSVGIEGSQDIEWSIKVAKELNLNQKFRILTLQEVEKIFEETAQILGKHLNIVNLGVGSVELAAIKLSQLSDFFSGLGSEEIFAGYQRHELSSNINEECWSGLKATWSRDFQRDYLISKKLKVNFLTPFLDEQLVITAMSINEKLKIKKFKKYILRKTALSLGLPEHIAFRPKKAAQYGSGFDKAIQKIAKAKFFRYKKTYLNYLSNNK